MISFLLLLATLHAAPQIQLSGDPKALKCGSVFLESILEQVAVGPRLEAVVGSYQLLVPTLTGAGVHPHNASLAFGLMDRFIHTSTEPAIEDLRFATQELPDESRMLVCVLKGSCKLIEGQQALHVFASSEFTPFLMDKVEKAKGAPVQIAKRHSYDVYQALVVNQLPEHPDAFQSQALKWSWMVDFAGEMGKFATVELITRWVEANRLRLERNLEPDALFQRYADSEDSQAVVDEGFVHLLMLTQSAQVYLAFLDFKIPEAGERVRQQEQTMEALLSFGEPTEHVIADYQVTPETILDVGMKLASDLRKTVNETPVSP